MKFWKPFTKWWAESSGGEWCYHADFELNEYESLQILLNDETSHLMKEISETTPPGKKRKFHLHFVYCEEDIIEITKK